MPDQNTQSTDESDRKLTRRDYLALSAAAGGMAGISQIGGASLDGETDGNLGVGGGPMSDEMAGARAQLYFEAESELPEPSGSNRVVRITEGGPQFDVDDYVKDTGDSWELINFGVGSLNAEEAHISGKPWVDVTAMGAEGDGETNDFEAIKDAFDVAGVGGTVYFPGDRTYLSEYAHDLGYDKQTVVFDEGAVLKAAPGQTVTEGDVGLLAWNGDHGDFYENITIIGGTVDGNEANVTVDSDVTEADIEGIELEFVRYAYIRGVTATAAVMDGFDLDYVSRSTVIGCTALSNPGYGIHVSIGSNRNRIISNTAMFNGHGAQRGGIDQFDSAENNIFLGNVADSNYRNFHIEGNTAAFVGNESLDSSDQVERTDVFTGASLIVDERVINERVQAGAFDTLQDAVDFCEANGWAVVKVPRGTYDGVVLPSEIHLKGDSRNACEIDPSGAHAVDVSGSHNTVSGFRLRAGTGPAVNIQSGAIQNTIRENINGFEDDFIRVDSNVNAIVNNHASAGIIELTSNADDCLVVGNTDVGTVTNNGTGNEVSGNS